MKRVLDGIIARAYFTASLFLLWVGLMISPEVYVHKLQKKRLDGTGLVDEIFKEVSSE